MVDKREGRPGDLGRETEELAPSHLLPGPKKRGPTTSAPGAAVLQVGSDVLLTIYDGRKATLVQEMLQKVRWHAAAGVVEEGKAYQVENG